MRELTGGQTTVEVSGATVRQVIESLERDYPGIKARLVEGRRLRPNINVAVDGIVSRLGLLQPVGEQSEVHFLPAAGGGEDRSAEAPPLSS